MPVVLLLQREVVLGRQHDLPPAAARAGPGRPRRRITSSGGQLEHGRCRQRRQEQQVERPARSREPAGDDLAAAPRESPVAGQWPHSRIRPERRGADLRGDRPRLRRPADHVELARDDQRRGRRSVGAAAAGRWSGRGRSPTPSTAARSPRSSPRNSSIARRDVWPVGVREVERQCRPEQLVNHLRVVRGEHPLRPVVPRVARRRVPVGAGVAARPPPPSPPRRRRPAASSTSVPTPNGASATAAASPRRGAARRR